MRALHIRFIYIVDEQNTCCLNPWHFFSLSAAFILWQKFLPGLTEQCMEIWNIYGNNKKYMVDKDLVTTTWWRLTKPPVPQGWLMWPAHNLYKYNINLLLYINITLINGIGCSRWEGVRLFACVACVACVSKVIKPVFIGFGRFEWTLRLSVHNARILKIAAGLYLKMRLFIYKMYLIYNHINTCQCYPPDKDLTRSIDITTCRVRSSLCFYCFQTCLLHFLQRMRGCCFTAIIIVSLSSFDNSAFNHSVSVSTGLKNVFSQNVFPYKSTSFYRIFSAKL